MRKTDTYASAKTAHSTVPLAECAMARAIEVIGDPWTLLIIRELVLGVQRFGEFCDDLSIPRSVLTNRLDKLLQHGIVEKYPYREEGQRERSGYRLTEKGEALYPAIIALRDWAKEWLPGGPTRLVLEHKDCGGRLTTKLVCEHGHEVQPGRDIARRLPADGRQSERGS